MRAGEPDGPIKKGTYILDSAGRSVYGDAMSKRNSNPNVRKAIEKTVGLKAAKKLEVDHIKPLADGGKDVLENIQLLPKKVH